MTFTDTGGWYGLFVPEDPNHLAATQWAKRNMQPLLTTNYVVDETLTLLRARGHAAIALSLGRMFFDGSVAAVYYLTDCTSKVIMEKLGITEAFAFDQHFRQFGTIMVVP